MPTPMSVASGEKLWPPAGARSSSSLKTASATGSGPSHTSIARACRPTSTSLWFGGQSPEVATEQLTTGGVVSTIVTTVVQLAVSCPSLTVTLTVCAPLVYAWVNTTSVGDVCAGTVLVCWITPSTSQTTDSSSPSSSST